MDPSAKFRIAFNLITPAILYGMLVALQNIYWELEETSLGSGPSTLLWVFIIGSFLWFAKTTLGFIQLYIQYIFYGLNWPAHNLVQRYGANSWALVTGGAGGIGREFVLYLCRQNINVIIIDRDECPEFLEQCAKDFPEVKVEHKQFDLTKVSDEAVMVQLMDEFSSKDISLIFHVAGICDYDFPWHEGNIFKMNLICDVNMKPSILLTRHFLPRLLARTKNSKNRSGILWIAAGAAEITIPAGVYGATKAFIDKFAQYLTMHYRNDPLDLMVVNPLGIATTMTENMAKEADGLDFITPWQLVDTVMRQFGRYSRSQGWFFHVFQKNIAKLMIPIFYGKLEELAIKENEEKAAAAKKKA